MTNERIKQIEQACNLYGSSNCWTGTTGTLATMLREMLADRQEMMARDNQHKQRLRALAREMDAIRHRDWRTTLADIVTSW